MKYNIPKKHLKPQKIIRYNAQKLCKLGHVI